jgi:hypothetical protein
MMRARCLSFIFFHCLHSSFVRRQPIQRPVFSSNLQMLMQGESTAMMSFSKSGGEKPMSHARGSRIQLIVSIMPIEHGADPLLSRIASPLNRLQ